MSFLVNLFLNLFTSGAYDMFEDMGFEPLIGSPEKFPLTCQPSQIHIYVFVKVQRRLYSFYVVLFEYYSRTPDLLPVPFPSSGVIIILIK